MDSATNRRQLDDWMNQRRRELRIRWTEVARRAKMSEENLRRIRRGHQTISEDAADGIEDALLWKSGSVMAAVERGERPTLRRDKTHDVVEEAVSPEHADPPIVDYATATLADLQREYTHFMELLPPTEMDRLYRLCQLYHELQVRMSRQSEGGAQAHA